MSFCHCDGLLRALKLVVVTRALSLVQERRVDEGVRERVLRKLFGVQEGENERKMRKKGV